METIIRVFVKEDWEEVKEIYRLGLLTSMATFETEVPEYDLWIKKFHSHLLFVAIIHNKVVGWAGLQPVSVRKAYEGVTEVTIYIHPEQSGKGIGSALMNHLVIESEKSGIWTLFSSIFPENKSSIYLHEKVGFRKIGYRERIAQLDGKWQDTVLFERRSKIVGM